MHLQSSIPATKAPQYATRARGVCHIGSRSQIPPLQLSELKNKYKKKTSTSFNKELQFSTTFKIL